MLSFFVWFVSFFLAYGEIFCELHNGSQNSRIEGGLKEKKKKLASANGSSIIFQQSTIYYLPNQVGIYITIQFTLLNQKDNRHAKHPTPQPPPPHPSHHSPPAYPFRSLLPPTWAFSLGTLFFSLLLFFLFFFPSFFFLLPIIRGSHWDKPLLFSFFLFYFYFLSSSNWLKPNRNVHCVSIRINVKV